jgi:hypothetical protein
MGLDLCGGQTTEVSAKKSQMAEDSFIKTTTTSRV